MDFLGFFKFFYIAKSIILSVIFLFPIHSSSQISKIISKFLVFLISSNKFHIKNHIIFNQYLFFIVI